MRDVAERLRWQSEGDRADRAPRHPKARTVTVEGATATMQAGLATTLNEVFAKPKGKGDVFKPGDPLGTLSFTAQGQ